jgi:hypothetical protein
MGMALADTFFLTTVKPSSFIFARTSYTSRQRKLAVSAIVRPWSSSFLRSLISASDQGSPEFASIGFTPAQLSGGEGVPPKARAHHRPRQNAPTVRAESRRGIPTEGEWGACPARAFAEGAITPRR